MLQANFTVTPTAGDVLATVFTFANLTTGASVKNYIWNFGDSNIVYDTVTPTHTYKYPGNYTISLTAIDFDNNTTSFDQQVSVDLAYRDFLSFSYIPERFSDPGLPTDKPFKITVISSNPNNPIIVDLFATNSKSTPYQFLPDKWNFLNPSWRFTDKNLNFITSLSVQPTPIYKNNTVVAVSGTAEFYYIDSISAGDPTTECPIFITATLQTSGFNYPPDSNTYTYSSHSNNQTVRAGIIWQVNNLFPNLLKVTGNYIDPVNQTQWTDIKIPTLITCHSNRSLLIPGSNDVTSEVLFTYPASNTTSLLKLSVSNLLSSEFTVDESPLYFKSVDENNFRTGGYIFTTITVNKSATNTTITGSTTANTGIPISNNEFFYPLPYAPNTSVWVSNPEKNTLNKITFLPYPENCKTINYFKENNVLVDGIIKEVSVPALTTPSTFNYAMTGFSGIYGMAIDPIDYSLVACDAELDRLYRFSETGEILKTLELAFELSSLNDFDPNKKAFFHWEYTITSSQLSSNNFYLYSPYYLSSESKNYIVSLGGVVQPPDTYTVDIETRILKLLTPDPTPGFGIKLDVVQIFNPTLPDSYINSLTVWTTASPTNQATFPLPTTLPLSANPGYYFVTIDGILQSYNNYSVNNSSKTITFTQPVLANTEVQVLYMPYLINPATWSQTFTSPTTLFSLTGNSNYIQTGQSDFIVNIGGVFQSGISYTHDSLNKQLVFSTPLPANIPIMVTQVCILDVVNNPAAHTPAGISLDKNSNIWITLFNSVSVLKFDRDFNLLFSCVPTTLPYYDYQFDSDFLYKPPYVETDKNSNCWVTYAHPLCSLLVQYGLSGNILNTITLPQYSVPVSIAINAQNNVWVGCTYNVLSATGDIRLYNSTTTQLMSTISGIARPGYLALDRSNNLWFTYGVRSLGYYDIRNQSLYLWKTESIGEAHVELIKSPDFDIEIHGELLVDSELQEQTPQPNEFLTDEDFGGLAVDVYNRLWVIDSYNNNAWVFLSATPTLEGERIFKIKPNNTQGYYINLDNGSTYTEEGNYNYKSAQATGDWTGNKWYQKYANPESLVVVCSGQSRSFNILKFEDKNTIRRINESFNNSDYFKSLALPENLNSNTTLFDQFFAAAVGTGYLSANEDLGQTVYEKIANFVMNHSDIDTCNIDQLLSLAEQTGVAASDYGANFPVEIRNMLDIASVPRSKLWGVPDLTPELPQSIGPIYNTLTDFVTAGTKIVLKNKFNGSINIVPVPDLNGALIYPLSSFEGYGFIQPVTTNYYIYQFNPVYSGNYIENIIDWNSQFTRLTPTLSSIEDWYGENGVIENTFRYLLTKNLFLK